MATGTVTPALLLKGPGILWWAALATAEPTHTPTASKFPTTAWGGSWAPLGSTDSGSQFSDSLDTDNITVAESVYAQVIVGTARAATWTTALAEWNKTNLTKALNGGTVTVTGTAATTLTQIDPPDVGQETRIMVGWQSEDDTVRFIGRQALQTGDVSAGFRKGADNATMAIVWRFEKPSAGGAPYSIYLAGTTRGA
jgi:hypothetical protein